MERINALNTLAARSGHSAGAERAEVNRRGAQAALVIGGLIVTIGAVLAGRGLWLVMLGGTPYLILSGIGYVASGAQLARRRAAGAWLATSTVRRLNRVGALGSGLELLGAVSSDTAASVPCIPCASGHVALSREQVLASRRAHGRACWGCSLGFSLPWPSCLTAVSTTCSRRRSCQQGNPDEPSDSYSDGRTIAGSR